MPRTKIPLIAMSPAGDLLAGASVNVIDRSSGAAANVYSTENAGATLAQPLTTDARGRVPGWVDRGRYRADFAAAGWSPWAQEFDSAPAGDGAIDASWLPDNILADRHIPSGLLTLAKLAFEVLPAGLIVPWAAGAAPAGWLICDGSVVSRTTYATLFAQAGLAFSGGTDPDPAAGGVAGTRFKLPDLRGRVPVGRSFVNAALGESGVPQAQVDTLGKSDGLAWTARKVSHQHGKGTLSASGGAHSHGTPNGYAFLTTNTTGGLAGDAGAQPYWPPNAHQYSTASVSHSHPNSEFSGAVGDTAGPTDLVPFQVFNWIVKV